MTLTTVSTTVLYCDIAAQSTQSLQMLFNFYEKPYENDNVLKVKVSGYI